MASDKSGHSERELNFYIPHVSFFQFENRNFWKQKFTQKKKESYLQVYLSLYAKKIEPLVLTTVF